MGIAKQAGFIRGDFRSCDRTDPRLSAFLGPQGNCNYCTS